MVFLSSVSKSINYAYLLSFLKFIAYIMLAIHSAPVFVFLRAIFKSYYLMLANRGIGNFPNQVKSYRFGIRLVLS